MSLQYVEVGICGLSCRLCPAYHRETKSKCRGCKSEYRMNAACPFHNCAVKKKHVYFCGFCDENNTCARWKKFREFGKRSDSFVCYQKVEDNIAFILEHGLLEFEKHQKMRENFLEEMLQGFDDGRSKSHYCIAATVLEVEELQEALTKAKDQSRGMPLKEKAKVMHSMLDHISAQKGYLLKLRK